MEKAGADEDPVRALRRWPLCRAWGLPQETVVPVLIAAVKQDQADINRAAIDGLLLVRPAGKVAVPALLPLLNEPPFAERAANHSRTLWQRSTECRAERCYLKRRKRRMDPHLPRPVVAIGAAAVPTRYWRRLESCRWTRSQRAHWTLRVLGSIGAAGLPELQKALAAPSVPVRLAALLTIQELGLDAREARDAVVKLTNDAEPAIRAGAVGSGGGAGRENRHRRSSRWKPGWRLAWRQCGWRRRPQLERWSAGASARRESRNAVGDAEAERCASQQCARWDRSVEEENGPGSS
jgi:hypothetical protein